MALGVGLCRPADVACLDTRTLELCPEGYLIRVFRSKNGGPGYSDPVMFPYSEGPTKCCPASTLKEYLRRTRDVRDSMAVKPNEPKPLILSERLPVAGLTSKRISSIAKAILAELGITSRAYSVRNRGTSAALDAGVLLHIVQRAGRWKSIQTMEAHYSKPADIHSVGLAILGKKSHK